MRVIGTAGHVDHGKSSLIAALTGIHPDRLKEERDREMTIDLGFAWMVLPNGEEVGIVDVPGHRDFIENMLAGVGGIDAVLFVIAADEGVMPQTREHLAILNLLQIPAGIVVLNKIDLIDDPEWLDLVEGEIREVTAGTILEKAPLVRVSARTKAGLGELIESLQAVLQHQPVRPDLGRPRLPVDRVFTMAGFGTVVTGTLSDGQLHTGDEVEILPAGLRSRIRGLQTHNQREEAAIPGSRTAVNLAGIEVDQIHRGAVVSLPGRYQATRLLDVQFQFLADASAPLKHSMEVKFFLGAAEILARVRLLGQDELQPGETGWLQLELRDPAVALRGDRYILRRPSPGETLGGGIVLDPHPSGRHKRFSAAVIQKLETYLKGTPDEVLFQACLATGAAPAREIIRRARLDEAQGREALENLINHGDLLRLDDNPSHQWLDSWVIPLPQWVSLTQQVGVVLQGYHKTYPLRLGMPREELKSRLKVSPRLFTLLWRKFVRDGILVENGAFVKMPGFAVTLSKSESAAVQALMDRIAQSPFAPPSIKEMQAELGEDLYQAEVDLRTLVPVSNEVAFRREDYIYLIEEVRKIMQVQGTITVAEFRDHFQTSRRYALAFLEHLDQIGMTVREEDTRRLK